MFRINHLLKLKNVSVKVLQRDSSKYLGKLQSPVTCFHSGASGLQRIQASSSARFYSKDSDDIDKKRLPHINEEECPKKPLVHQECPQAKPDPLPDCVREEITWWELYKNAVYMGLLMAAATLGTLYYLGFFDKKKEEEVAKKKKKKRVPIKDPPSSKYIPDQVPYLLVGGGTASFAAFRAIKSADPTAKVLVVTDESFHPYMRPPLSKEMWYNEDEESVKKLNFKQWNGTERNLYYEPEDFYLSIKDFANSENGGVAVARGWTVKRIDPLNRIAYLEDDKPIEYEKCLIATGANPKVSNVFEAACKDRRIDEKVKVFRNIFDFEDVFDAFEEAETVAIIGGGFLGSELACSLARKGRKLHKDVYQIFRENGNMAKVLPEYLCNWTTRKVRGEGVHIIGNTEVIGVKYENNKVNLVLNNGKTMGVDHVILAVGAEANTQLAAESGLEVDPDLGGYLVNTELMARSHLYIAGDCACFYDVKFGRRRVEHHDHAVVTGRLAGENMTGSTNPYVHQSMFWSDLGPDVGYEAIGVVDASLPTVGVFAKASSKDSPQAVVTETGDGMRSSSEAEEHEEKEGESKGDKSEDYGKGIIFYLRDDVVVGIVLWNVFNRMSVARQVLKDEKKYDDLNEVAKLFNIHED